MFFVALVADYDGTLAKDGRVDAATVEALKDAELTSEAGTVENDESLSPRDSRTRIKEMIDHLYTAPAMND